jgi:hypothetical protein
VTAGGVSRNVIHRKYVLLCHGLTIPMAVEVEKANHHGWMGERTIRSTDKKLRMMTLTPDEADERGAWWKIFMEEPGRGGNERGTPLPTTARMTIKTPTSDCDRDGNASDGDGAGICV